MPTYYETLSENLLSGDYVSFNRYWVNSIQDTKNFTHWFSFGGCPPEENCTMLTSDVKFSDTCRISDSIDLKLLIAFSEYLIAQCNSPIVGKYRLLLSELSMLLDTPQFHKVYSHILSENLRSTDAIAIRKVMYQALSDTVRLLDTLVLNQKATVKLGDILNVKDKLVQGYKCNFFERIQVQDTLNRLYIQYVIFRDFINIEDNFSTVNMVSLSELVSVYSNISNILVVEQTFKESATVFCKIMLDNVQYDCWVLNTHLLAPSMYTDYNFNSYAVLNNQCFAAKEDGIYLLDSVEDEDIETGVRVDLTNLGTKLKKRLYRAYFGVAGKTPTIKVISDDLSISYFIIEGRADVATGQQGVSWVFELTKIEALDFIEITPIILSR